MITAEIDQLKEKCLDSFAKERDALLRILLRGPKNDSDLELVQACVVYCYALTLVKEIETND